MRRRLWAPILLLGALLSTGCGGGGAREDLRVRGDTLTVYLSVPQHGLSATRGAAAAAGARRALAQAGGRAGGRGVRLVTLSSTRPGDPLWDPGTVKSNAERAEDDPTAIAYVGELDLGGSAVSLPVTNGAGLLQVSPTDGLTSITRAPPGGPRAGPERYYPEGRRSFVRLVPSDLDLARALLARLRGADAGRTVLLHTGGIAERELAGVLATIARRRGREPVAVETIDEDREAVPGLVRRVAADEPDAVVVAAVRTPATERLLDALAARLPEVPVLGGPWTATPRAGPAESAEPAALTGVAPPPTLPRDGRRLLAELTGRRRAFVAPEALHAYEAMRLVLDAIATGGPDRGRVVRAALSARDRSSPLGRYAVLPTGDVRGLPLTAVDLDREGPPPQLRSR